MRDLDHAERVVSAVVEAVCVPVTLKMRLGWDAATINAPELAARAERAGVRMVIVHGRTRTQFYEGRADWGAARAVVDAVSLPVIVNGDCAGVDDARDMLAQSGAHGVMIGRAAVGAPWLVGAVSRALADGGPIRLPSVGGAAGGRDRTPRLAARQSSARAGACVTRASTSPPTPKARERRGRSGENL